MTQGQHPAASPTPHRPHLDSRRSREPVGGDARPPTCGGHPPAVGPEGLFRRQAHRRLARWLTTGARSSLTAWSERSPRQVFASSAATDRRSAARRRSGARPGRHEAGRPWRRLRSRGSGRARPTTMLAVCAWTAFAPGAAAARRITRWEHGEVLEAMQRRLGREPHAMRIRR